MNINIHTAQPLAPPSSPPRHVPETSDINWFSASLKTPASGPVNNTPSDNHFAPSLSQRSELLQGLSDQAARRLQKVSNSTDPVDMIRSTRAMSAFHLETVLTAKMISKTSQAIEKLTNLS
ncbi:MAG: EscI/YscI/HrpB family type III secretion system inner rod protein [Pseudomonadota bacterium]